MDAGCEAADEEEEEEEEAEERSVVTFGVDLRRAVARERSLATRWERYQVRASARIVASSQPGSRCLLARARWARAGSATGRLRGHGAGLRGAAGGTESWPSANRIRLFSVAGRNKHLNSSNTLASAGLSFSVINRKLPLQKNKENDLFMSNKLHF